MDKNELIPAIFIGLILIAFSFCFGKIAGEKRIMREAFDKGYAEYSLEIDGLKWIEVDK